MFIKIEKLGGDINKDSSIKDLLGGQLWFEEIDEDHVDSYEVMPVNNLQDLKDAQLQKQLNSSYNSGTNNCSCQPSMRHHGSSAPFHFK